MGYIGNSPGLAIKQKFKFIAGSNQTVFTGLDSSSLILNYRPGQIDVFVNGRHIPDSDYTATSGSSITFAQGLSLSDEVLINAYGAFSPADTLLKSNNGADILDVPTFRQNIDVGRYDSLGYKGLLRNNYFEVLQELVVDTPYSVTNVFYPTDMVFCQNNGSGAFTATNVYTSPSYSGKYAAYFPISLSVNTTTAKLSYGANDYLAPYCQAIEGTIFRHLAWGTSYAKNITIVAIVFVTVPGIYMVSVMGADRNYVRPVTLTAGINHIYETIPGCTDGNWVTNVNSAVTIRLGSVAGSNNNAVSTNTWGTGQHISHSSATNWGDTVSNKFVTLYANVFEENVLPLTGASDPNFVDLINSIRIPFDDELRRCKRYFQIVRFVQDYYATINGQVDRVSMTLPVVLRTTPIISSVNVNFSNVSAVSWGVARDVIFQDTTSNTSGYVGSSYDLYLNARTV